MPQPLKSDFPPPATPFESSGSPAPGRKIRKSMKEKRLGVAEQLKRAVKWYRQHPIDIARCAGDCWPRMLGRTHCLI